MMKDRYSSACDQSVLRTTILLITIVLASAQGSQPRNELLPLLHQCSCLGFHLAFECAVTGEAGATVWRGSIFQCPSTNNTITLLHSVFTQMRGCNNGAIIGRGISSQNSCYISQINITTSSSMNNGTVECLYNTGSVTSVIGTSMITVISDPLPPPNDVSILTINSTQLAFGWSPVAAECPTIYYSTDTIGCGVCETITHLPIAYCTEVRITGQTCTFAIRTNACNGLVGDKSKPVSTLLRTPDAPVVDVIPLYTQMRNLSAIMTTFYEVEGFNISAGIDGSAHSYQISYTDSINGFKCDLAIIPAQSCINGTCKHVFNVSSACPDSNGITVTVSGFNRLGEGRMSDPVVVPVTNQFFVATFDVQHSSVVCTFLINSQQYKSCNLTYGLKQSCNEYSQSSGSASNIVLIGLPAHNVMQFHGAIIYCYTLTASIGTHTVMMKGTFVTDCDLAELSDDTQVPNGVSCATPLENMSLGIQDGVVCYTGSSVGSTAAYYCLSCDQKSIALKRETLRLCTANGSWDGDIPRCTCFSNQLCLSGLFIGIAVVSNVLLIAIITTVLVIVVVKRKMHKEPDNVSTSQVIYEDIPSVSNQLKTIDTESNAAYISASDGL